MGMGLIMAKPWQASACSSLASSLDLKPETPNPVNLPKQETIQMLEQRKARTKSAPGVLIVGDANKSLGCYLWPRPDGLEALELSA